MTARDRDFQTVSARIDALVRELDQGEQPGTRSKSRELVRLLMRLYGEGLSRILSTIAHEDAGTQRRLLDGLAADELVSSLLLLHELHPHDPATRIARGLDRVSQLCGAPLRVAHYGADAVRVAVDGPINAWSTPADVSRAIEEVVLAVAPDVARVSVEGLPERAPEQFVTLQRRRLPAPESPTVSP